MKKKFLDVFESIKSKFYQAISKRIYKYDPNLTNQNLLGVLAKNSSSKTDKRFKLLKPAREYLNSTERMIKIPEELLEHDLEIYLSKDNYPLPTTIDREGYAKNRHFDYWISGLIDYLSMRKILMNYGLKFSENFPSIEIGCATGRVLRHLLCQEELQDQWGTDINGSHIEWIRRFLPESAKVFQNSILPHLPVCDNKFSLVSAFSVFTHIDEFELGWLAELNRILKPGGVGYLTILGEHTWKKFNPESEDFNNIKWLVDGWVENKMISQGKEVNYKFFEKSIPVEKTVLRYMNASIYNTVVFHSTEYIYRTWGRFFNILEIIPSGHSFQDVVLVQKP